MIKKKLIFIYFLFFTSISEAQNQKVSLEISYRNFSEDTNIISFKKRFHDERGNILIEKTFEGLNNWESTTTWLYDSLCILTYDRSDERIFIRSLINKYDTIDSRICLIISQKFESRYGGSFYKSIEIVNIDNQIVKEFEFNRYFSPSNKKEYYYDESGRLTKELKFYFDEAEGFILLVTSEYTY